MIRKVMSFVFGIYRNSINRLVFKRLIDQSNIASCPTGHLGNNELNGLKGIVHVNTYDKGGGAAAFASSLCTELSYRGYDSKLIVAKKSGDDGRTFALEKYRSVRSSVLDFLQLRNDWNGFFENSYENLLTREAVTKADIVHLHNIHGSYFNPLIIPALSSQKTVIWTLHDTQELVYPCTRVDICEDWHDDCANCNVYDKSRFHEKNFLIWKKKKEVLTRSKLTIVCPSAWLRNKIGNSILNNGSVEVIHNGIDTKVFRNKRKIEKRKTLGLPEHKFIICFVAHGGIDNPSKGGKYFTEVYNRLKHDPDMFFVNIGGSKSGNRRRNWVNVGYIDDKKKLASYYSMADLFVYPSMSDVFGLVVAESIACGTPVITFKTGGIPEIVEHMVTGYVAPQGNVDELVNGIMVFYKDANLRDRTRVIGPRVVQEKFSIDRTADKYLQLYQNKLFEHEKATQLSHFRK